jgi:hypothetical protein
LFRVLIYIPAVQSTRLRDLVAIGSWRASMVGLVLALGLGIVLMARVGYDFVSLYFEIRKGGFWVIYWTDEWPRFAVFVVGLLLTIGASIRLGILLKCKE